ncbi:MAG: Ig-like domain-containing protein [bacterium]|nr:Ig-like domain-containing protein [bacterium]
MRKFSRGFVVTVFALLILGGLLVFGAGKFAGNQQATIIGSMNKTVTLQNGLAGYSGTSDTYIYSFPTYDILNFGNLVELRSSPVEKYNVLVRFKIFQSEGGPIPNNSEIIGAKLSLYKYTPYDSTFATYRIKKDWLETEATWLKARENLPWTKPGELNADDFITTPDSVTNIGWDPGWLAMDVTAGVRAFAGGEFNAGWEIIGISGNSNIKTFYSREWGMPDLRPKLIVIYTLPAVDTSTPSIPTGLTATAVSSSQINLVWSASTNNATVAGYKIFRGGTQIATVESEPGALTRTTYSNTGLSPSTSYTYTVAAYNAAGNNSAQSTSANATTLASTDTTSPTVSITAPTSGVTVSGTITVSANASDNVGVAGVQFKLDGTNLGSEDTTSPYSTTWNTTTVSNGSHALTAVARDIAGNTAKAPNIVVTVSNPITVTPSTKFVIGDRVQVTATLNVRSTPSTSGTILGTQTPGALGTVIGGPTYASGYHWWQVNYDNAPDGWSVENYLVKASSGSPGQIKIPLNQWVALRAPYPYSTQGIPSANKHVTGAYHPPSGRIYFEGGDYAGKHGSTQSYRQETWSLSIAERFADKNNPAAGWRLEYPYCGPVDQIQPKHPDFVGWVWDQKRGLFYMVPGVMESTSIDNCPGETADKVTNPGFISNKMMSFNPVTKLWAIMGDGGAYAQDTWMSVLDPVTDSLIRFDIFGVGRGSIYNLTTNTWSTFSMPSISLWKEALAADISGRLIYAIDGYRGKLWSYNIDSRVFTDLGPVPGGAINYDNVTYLVWDSASKVLLWHKEGTAFNAYHPDTKTWETLSIASDIPSVNARGRHGMTYDPGQNVVFLFGGSVSYDENPYIFLYRYGNGGGPTADTVAPSKVSGLSATAVSSSQINLSWGATTDNVGVAGYRIYRGGVQIATSNVTSYQNTGLLPSTSYAYTVAAYDTAGNVSPQSISASATTQTSASSVDTSAIDSLHSGQWFMVPNSQLSAVAPSPLPPGRLSSVIDAWSGGAYDTTRDRLIVWGGGHGDYGGNEIYTFDVNTLKWSRPWGPSPNIPDPLGAPCHITYTDGNPVSRHTYSGLQYAPNVDKFWIQGGSLACGGGGAGNDTWTFDFSALKWTQKQNIPQTQLGVQTAYDPVTGHIFEQSMTKFFEYDPVGNIWTQRGDVGGDLGERNRTAVIDPVNRYFVSIGDGQFFVWDLRTFRYFTPITSGVSGLQNTTAPGLDYDPISKKIILWKGGTDVYSLDTTTWTWARIAAASTNTVIPTSPTATGTYGRFRYVPSKNEFILVNNVYGNVYIYKLSAGSGI